MPSTRTRRVRPLLLSAALAIATTLGATACGFRPIYAESSGLTQAFEGVDVSVGQGRASYLVRQASLNAFGATGAPEYDLRLTVGEFRRGFGITAEDVATRFEVVLNVSYQLVRLRDNQVLDTGRVTSAASFDVPFNPDSNTEDPFSNIAAEENAKERAADLAAQRLREELAYYFQTNPA